MKNQVNDEVCHLLFFTTITVSARARHAMMEINPGDPVAPVAAGEDVLFSAFCTNWFAGYSADRVTIGSFPAYFRTEIQSQSAEPVHPEAQVVVSVRIPDVSAASRICGPETPPHAP